MILRSLPRAVVTACLAAALCAVGLGWSPRARANGITLDRYSPAELPSDGFVVSRPNDLGSGRWALQLHVEYANDPLVAELNPGKTSSERAAVVSDQAVAHLEFALGIADRLVLFTGLSANLLMKGDAFFDPVANKRLRQADGAGLGPAHAGARLRLFGEKDDFLAMALQARVGLPLADVASNQRFAGDSGITVLPELVTELRPGSLRIDASIGALVRPDVKLPHADVSNAVPFGLGLGIPLVTDRLDALVELHGATTFDDFFGRTSTGLELLAGGKYWVAPGWVLGAAGGPGLNRGVGSPDYRLVVMLGYEKPEPPPLPPPPPPADRDHDGLLDRDDKCPDKPEDTDDFEDGDGCPEPDNDKDGILDVNDNCPLEPEDTDDFEDSDGCFEPDNDKDGILDQDDECLNDPEDKDGFEDKNGCPDPDNDNDGVLDADDKCPLDPGPASEKGCPRVLVVEGQIRILDRVEFATGKDVILAKSEGILNAVRDVFAHHEDIKRVRVEGHTDDHGRAKANMELSRRRAASVKRWLIEHGVAAERLEAWGCGQEHPIEDNKTSDGRQANRRVEFHILEPATPGAEERQGCVPAK
jgi:outer membrane protein OmpA-like peptidoglycan-associated protein